MKRKYHVVNSSSKGAAKTIRNFCQANGQMLLPLVDLISEARLAVDEIIDQAGRSLIETILTVSAEQAASEKTPGKATGEVRWHGRQKGHVRLADRQLLVERPLLHFTSTSPPSRCAEDFHLQAVRHARHTTCQPSLDAHFNSNLGATLAG